MFFMQCLCTHWGISILSKGGGRVIWPASSDLQQPVIDPSGSEYLPGLCMFWIISFVARLFVCTQCPWDLLVHAANTTILHTTFPIFSSQGPTTKLVLHLWKLWKPNLPLTLKFYAGNYPDEHDSHLPLKVEARFFSKFRILWRFSIIRWICNNIVAAWEVVKGG